MREVDDALVLGPHDQRERRVGLHRALNVALHVPREEDPNGHVQHTWQVCGGKQKHVVRCACQQYTWLEMWKSTIHVVRDVEVNNTRG